MARFAWFQPMRWIRWVDFAILLTIDFKHIYQFVAQMLDPTATVANDQSVILFGQWLPGITNGQFDSLAFGFFITSMIFFLTNTLISRWAHGQKGLVFTIALIIGTLVSALANADVMSRQWVWGLLQGYGWSFPSSAAMGAIVTCGLILFAGMDSWERKTRMEKARATRAKNKAAKEEEARKAKHTPTKYRKQPVDLASVKSRRRALNS